MKTLFKLSKYDKLTEYLVDRIDITNLISEKEIKILLNEKGGLYNCYPLSKHQLNYLENHLNLDGLDKYDCFLEFPGDWALETDDLVWTTDKSPITHQEADKAFASNDPEKIKDALIRTVFFDENPQRIQTKCLIYLDNENSDLQREAIIGLGHLARIHGKLDKTIVVPKLKALEKNSELIEVIEEALDDIEAFLDVKRQE